MLSSADESIQGVAVEIPTNHREIPGSTPGRYNLQIEITSMCVIVFDYTKVNHIIDAWRNLGPAPIMRNAVHPTIPYHTLPISAQKRKRGYPSTTEDSIPGEGDGSPQWIVNTWAMMWGTKQTTPGEVDG